MRYFLTDIHFNKVVARHVCSSTSVIVFSVRQPGFLIQPFLVRALDFAVSKSCVDELEKK